jgi:eukaryotic-like serine/threonine-protein kinase
MTESTWQLAKEIFNEALSIAPAEREAFLDSKCGADRALRAEVEKLLGAYDSEFLEDNLLETAEALAEPLLPFGAAIGRYRIRELIGTGGMGQVFLADDTELDRPVAFKVLHRDVADSGERVRRFIQEARAASALNHPNILTIHEVGSHDGSRFIVSEYVEGDTLRERMRGGLTVADSIEITCQIAAALQAAHAAGIVHRDIKPENVMIRSDGLVKVLDFGLAKLTEADDLPIDQSAPLSRVHTTPGLVMGTVAYMSPEQARGHAVDTRTDLWSLGVVLHEMLTGKSPFEGDSMTELVSSILSTETTLVELESLPPELTPICQKALTKEKEKRYQSAHDLLEDLKGEKKRMEYAMQNPPLITVSSTDDLKTQLIRPRPTLSAEYVVSTVKRHKYATLTAVLLVLTGAVGISVYRYNAATPSGSAMDGITPVIGELTTENELKMTRFSSSGSVNNIAVSPDGKYIAYTTTDGVGKKGIRLRDIKSGDEKEIVPAPPAGTYWALSFSPTSDQLLYALTGLGYTRQQLFRLPLHGGDGVRIQAESTDSGASMSPDSKMIAFITERYTSEVERDLIISDPSGANQRTLIHTSGSETWVDCGPTPTWSPDGKSLACWKAIKTKDEQFYQVYSVSITDGQMRSMADKKWGPITGSSFMPDGSLVVAAQELTGEQSAPSQLWLINTTGNVKRITSDLTGYSTLSSTRAGDVMVSLRVRSTADLWLMNGKDGSQARQVTSSGEFTNGFNWTANGKILFVSDVSGNKDIWIMNPDGSGRAQITRNNGANEDAWMTKDGRYIVFVNRRNFNNGHVFRMDANGSNLKQLSDSTLREWTPRLSPDDKWVYYVEVPGSRTQRICKVSIDGGQSVTLGRLDEKLHIWDVSPTDGRILIEYQRQGDNVRHVVILSPKDTIKEGSIGWPPSAIKFDLPASARGMIRFTPDGKYIAFRDTKDGKACVSILPTNGQGTPKVLLLLDAGFQGVRWSYDGKQLANIKRNVSSEALVITNAAN